MTAAAPVVDMSTGVAVVLGRCVTTAAVDAVEEAGLNAVGGAEPLLCCSGAGNSLAAEPTAAPVAAGGGAVNGAEAEDVGGPAVTGGVELWLAPAEGVKAGVACGVATAGV